MNSSEYQTYLNYLFDVFYCTLIALYFFSRWSSKEEKNELERNSTLATFDPEALNSLVKVNGVTEHQPIQQPQQPQQQLKTTTQQAKSHSPKPTAQSNNNKNHKSKKGNNNGAKTNKNKQSGAIYNSGGNSGGSYSGNGSNVNNWATKTVPKDPKRGANKKDSISLEDGDDFNEDDATSGAICGVTGSVAAGDLTFSFANITFFDVICISFVFPLCLLAIYLAWNMQVPSLEVSWLSWRWLWGWWTERWTWWRLAGCLLAVVGITVWVKPKKVMGKIE